MRLQALKHPNVISTLSQESASPLVSLLGGTNWNTISDTIWPVANLAIFVPFVLAMPASMVRIGILNGAVIAANFDAGVYTEDGVRIASTGATAQAGAFTFQQVALSANFGPGRFYMALVKDDIVATVSRLTLIGATGPAVAGVAQMAAAYPLPANAVLAAVTGNYIPIIGLLFSPKAVF
jgi:hypothetical protein